MSSAKESTIEKVAKLLSQANHPSTGEAEAEAFRKKAMLIMQREAITEAMVNAHADKSTSAEPIVKLFTFEKPPHAKQKRVLFSYIALGLGCKVVLPHHGKSYNLIEVYGFKEDIERADALYDLLILDVLHQVSTSPNSYDTAWRNAFIIAYASAVNQRLLDARKEAVSERNDSGSTELVLADRGKRVESMVTKAYPKLTRTKISYSSMSGAKDGWKAGQKADLGLDPKLSTKTQRVAID